MRLLFADEHVPIVIIDALTDRGAKVLSLTELGLENTGVEDHKLLKIATEHQSTVITL